MAQSTHNWPVSGSEKLARLGLVVHPTRDVDGPLRAVQAWAQEREVELAQIAFGDQPRRLLEAGEASECDLVLAIGGDGTTLAAIRSAAAADRAVLGVACGSLGALTAVPASEVQHALDRVADGDWVARSLPALRVGGGKDGELLAYNDIAAIRQGDGQVRVTATVDGALYARVAGDGCIVSTAIGSSAYTLAAGGPLLDPRLDAFVFTKLSTHGGFCPPLVIGSDLTLELKIQVGHGGGRLEVDGRTAPALPEQLSISLSASAATVVAFADGESHLSGLRRRGIIMDSPRILADDRRG